MRLQHRLGVAVRPPNVNEGESDFTVRNGEIFVPSISASASWRPNSSARTEALTALPCRHPMRVGVRVGDDVVDHYLNYARVELNAFNAAAIWPRPPSITTRSGNGFCSSSNRW